MKKGNDSEEKERSGSAENNDVPTYFGSFARARFEELLSNDSDDGDDDAPTDVRTDAERNARNQSGSRTRSSDDVDEIVLSVIWANGGVGGAYYNILTSELFVMNDVKDDPVNFNVTKTLYKQCQPRYVVTIAGTNGALVNAIKRLIVGETMSEECDSSENAVQVVLRTMPRKEHGYESCYHRVRCLKLETEPKDASNPERFAYLNSVLDFKSNAMIHALGLLLMYIDKHWNGIALSPTGRPSFVSLCYVMLRDLVMVDEDTYKALNIVKARYHPSYLKFGKTTSVVQGISLFTLLNRCQSRPGEQFLWKTIRHPTRDIRVLDQRFAVIAFFLDPTNRSIVENLTLCLKHISRVTNEVLDRYAGPQAKASDWYRLYETISYVIHIADICQSVRQKTELFERIASCVTNEMHCIKYFVEYIVDSEASKHESSLVVKSNVDPLLDELNHLRSSLPQLLTQMGERDMREHLPASVTGCGMLYLPNIGYVLAIKECNPTPPEDTVFPGLEFKFVINGIRYYKSPGARELDESIGDIMLKIAKRQSQIVMKLVRYIKKHVGPVMGAIRLCAELDTLLSFYTVARDYNYVRPSVIESQVIAVRQARHPLQEHLTSVFVPNDIYSGNGESLVKILTGPNACGKSIYLKQVALIVFMAHIGCYVPAESATIGVVTHILTQIQTVDSIAVGASTFLQGLRQINHALYASTPNALVIIDEFGKGTSEISGSSLLAAVLSSFLDRTTYCPHVFAATHNHCVVKLLKCQPTLETRTFEFISNDDLSLTFLYRLTSGNVTRSFAHAVAKSAGLNQSIVERAVEICGKRKEAIFPPRLSEAQRKDTAVHVIERVVANAQFDLEELKSWVRQAILPPSKK